MPRKRKWPPSILRHKSGQAFIRVHGQNIYLGPWGEGQEPGPMVKQRFQRWLAHGTGGDTTRCSFTCQDVTLAFLKFAIGRYSKHGKPTVRYHHYRRALAIVVSQYGTLPALELGPVALDECRKRMVGRNCGGRRPGTWSRTYINMLVGLIRRVWRWAVGREMVPAAVHAALCSLESLYPGEGGVPEGRKIRPAVEAHVHAVLERGKLPAPVAAVLRLQMLTGARVEELVSMRRRQLNSAGIDSQGVTHEGMWIYTPEDHKNKWRGPEWVKEIPLNAAAQAVIAPFLKPDFDAYLFSPRDSRPGRKGKRTPGARYTGFSYPDAIARGCVNAGVPHFSPRQVRKLVATKVRVLFSTDKAAALLGNTPEVAAKHYAERLTSAVEVARKLA